MPRKVRIAIAGELYGAEGEPLFGRAALTKIASPHIELLRLDHDRRDVRRCCAYDAIYLNTLRVDAARLAGSDLRLRLIARHGAATTQSIFRR